MLHFYKSVTWSCDVVCQVRRCASMSKKVLPWHLRDVMVPGGADPSPLYCDRMRFGAVCWKHSNKKFREKIFCCLLYCSSKNLIKCNKYKYIYVIIFNCVWIPVNQNTAQYSAEPDLPRYTIGCRGRRRTAWRAWRCAWTGAPPGWRRPCSRGCSCGTCTACLCCAACGETGRTKTERWAPGQCQVAQPASHLPHSFYLKVGQLRERLFAARVATLVRPVASVDPGRGWDKHTNTGVLIACIGFVRNSL